MHEEEVLPRSFAAGMSFADSFDLHACFQFRHGFPFWKPCTLDEEAVEELVTCCQNIHCRHSQAKKICPCMFVSTQSFQRPFRAFDVARPRRIATERVFSCKNFEVYHSERSNLKPACSKSHFTKPFDVLVLLLCTQHCEDRPGPHHACQVQRVVPFTELQFMPPSNHATTHSLFNWTIQVNPLL